MISDESFVPLSLAGFEQPSALAETCQSLEALVFATSGIGCQF